MWIILDQAHPEYIHCLNHICLKQPEVKIQSLDSVYIMTSSVLPVVAGEKSLLDGPARGALCAHGQAATYSVVELVKASALTFEMMQEISLRPKMTECPQHVIAAFTQVLIQASFTLQTNISLYDEV